MISVAGARFGTVDLTGLSAVGGSVAYASYGPEDAPAVMVLGGISAHRNLSTTMGHSTGLIREQCPVW